MTFKASAAEVLALAAAGMWLGQWAQRRVAWLERANIPSAITGGLLVSLPFLLAQSGLFGPLEVTFDTTLRDLLMVAFFITIGLGASLRVLKEGGGLVVMVLGLAIVGALVQNLTGVGMAMALGMDPRVGILAGAMTLAGGPATALAFSGDFAKAGVADAQTLALASAVTGILAAGLLSTSVGGWWIARFRLQGNVGVAAPVQTEAVSKPAPISLLLLLGLLVACLGLGSFLTRGFIALGIKLPEYIGGLLVGAVVRYLLERRGSTIRGQELGLVGRLCLQLFMVMTLLTLRWSALVGLGPKLALLLAVQIGVTLAMGFLVPRLLASVGGAGRYEAAVIATGWCGFMLGTTANAVTAMEELTRKHGPALRAYAVVPVVGGFLIDFTNSILILGSADLVQRFLLP